MPFGGFGETIFEPNGNAAGSKAGALRQERRAQRCEPPEADERGIAEEEFVITNRNDGGFVVTEVFDVNHDSLPFRFVLLPVHLYYQNRIEKSTPTQEVWI